MSIWGKIIGATVGLAVGGPLGMLVGAAGGHFVDRAAARHSGNRSADSTGPGGQEDVRRVTFTLAVIVLGAKMAKADGRVSPDEVAAFKQAFRIPQQEMKEVGRLFNLARQDAEGFEVYARQIAAMFADAPEMLSELLWFLAQIARADHDLHPAELRYLRRVADIFGTSQAEFERIAAVEKAAEKSDPYRILGVKRSDDLATIKDAYRKLAVLNHPDKLIAKGMPEEFVTAANDKLAVINAAYDKIMKARA